MDAWAVHGGDVLRRGAATRSIISSCTSSCAVCQEKCWSNRCGRLVDGRGCGKSVVRADFVSDVPCIYILHIRFIASTQEKNEVLSNIPRSANNLLHLLARCVSWALSASSEGRNRRELHVVAATPCTNNKYDLRRRNEFQRFFPQNAFEAFLSWSSSVSDTSVGWRVTKGCSRGLSVGGTASK